MGWLGLSKAWDRSCHRVRARISFRIIIRVSDRVRFCFRVSVSARVTVKVSIRVVAQLNVISTTWAS